MNTLRVIRLWVCAVLFLNLAVVSSLRSAETPALRVGVAQVDITPDYAVRLSGFGFRRTESEGVNDRIFAKALVFADEERGPAILIAADNLCVPDAITEEIAKRLEAKVRLKRERLAITATHTHTGPMLKDVCPTLFGVPIPPEHQANIDRYTTEFIDKLEEVALAAMKEIRQARVSYGLGAVGFAVNRRTKGGPVDHDLPVLAVHEADGKLRALYFSYACHCVTLSDNKISGDWAGFAQHAVQADHPGVIALASVGCGADSNPSSGVTGGNVEVCRDQGREIANEVKRILSGRMTAITAAPMTRLTRVDIPFDTPRTRAEWEERAKLQDAVGHHARVTLAKLDRGETLPAAMNYPIQSWIFGNELALVFLPGETVVDYSLRLKGEYDRARLWVNGYSNDGRCYVPSERVLQEGGYEGGGAMIYYDFPQRFAPGLEDKIIGAVAAQLPETFKAYPGAEGTRPLEPEQALGAFTTKPGLVVELVAAEPLVQDPVAIDWGPDGKLWVCEMHDYPSGTDNNWQPGGRVKFLEDRDGDGKYEHATVFADRVPFPTGLMAWKGGVIICAAPDILFARDENGDGKADKIEKLFSGFATDNYQARVNSPTLGLDNWIYAANGLLGGNIVPQKNSLWPTRGVSGVDIRGRDIRFSPKTGVLETVSGLTQYGRTRDDWGNWFGCDNTRLLLHFPWPERYMKRNPHVAQPNPVRLTTGPNGNRLFPTSRLMERFNDPDNANRVTSAGGIAVYRDTHLGAEFYGNVFTCEPVHNLVHREVLSGELLISSARPEDERETEFLSSRDNWFRPAQARTGPDGALYVVDMYRFLIEHPRWIPAERLAKIDIRAGADRGRIYRVRRKDEPLRAVRDLTKLIGSELAAAMDSPNGIERDRVHAELLARGEKSAVPALKRIARESKLPQARVQALAALAGFESVDRAVCIEALWDGHAGVREFALQLAESMLKENRSRALMDAVLALKEDESVRVQRQLAFTLGELKEEAAGEALAQIARTHLKNAEMRAAVLSSALPHGAAILKTVAALPSGAEGVKDWLEPLIATAVGTKDEAMLARALQICLPGEGAGITPDQLTTLAKLLEAAGRDDALRKKLVRSEESRLSGAVASARTVVSDAGAGEAARVAALKLMAAAGNENDRGLLVQVATGPETNFRRVALASLRNERSAKVAAELLQRWEDASPAARSEIVSLLMDRAEWSKALLEAIQSEKVSAHAVSLADRQRLWRSEVASIRKLATEVLPEIKASARAEVVERYKPALSRAGNVAEGAKLFATHCASCHALNGVGHDVGPDLATLRSKEAEYWLLNILDPNAAIEPRFVSYEAELADDRTISGVIKNETATTLAMAGGNGVTETVFRSNVRKLRALGLSLMPEGLEGAMQPEEMADLIAYVRGGASAKEVKGNKPMVISADREGAYLMTANSAEIFGDQITLESEFQNIGLWHGNSDYVSWWAEIKKAAVYDVYFDYACAAGSAGNGWRLTAGNEELKGKVVATGEGWSNYRQVKVGALRMEAGTQRITLRPEGDVRGALIDLRTLALVPSGQVPRMAKAGGASSSEVLRDAASVARFILDPSRSQSARETAVQANPQFAAALITEMTRDLPTGKEEYVRIPWIWRVAIACGRRNDAGQIRAMLDVSVPQIDQPLRDWQAVVIGGGIINGISERGVAPAARVREIIGSDAALLKRWERSLELASKMADDAQVPSGTWYDALRMIGMESWEKRGEQLVRYLVDNNAELQMGAVSSLADMYAEVADRALIEAVPNLTEGNRELALNAVVKREAALELMKAVEQGKIAKENLSEAHRGELLRHGNATVREKARKLLN